MGLANSAGAVLGWWWCFLSVVMYVVLKVLICDILLIHAHFVFQTAATGRAWAAVGGLRFRVDDSALPHS